MRILRICCCVAVLGVGCADDPPYRTLAKSYDHTQDYDLYFVEFDDQGWLADTIGKSADETTQLDLVMRGLQGMIGGGRTRFNDRGVSEDVQPLSVIVYTHGWHHSAAENDSDVEKFRGFLSDQAAAERQLCQMKRDELTGEYGLDLWDPATECKSDESGIRPWMRKRRVVGIYVGWRGDSAFPSLSWFNWITFWDRKLAAEKVALGAVQELFAKLHDFYLEHSCHIAEMSLPGGGKANSSATQLRLELVGARDVSTCADVRMLTIGHSFGGLIDYRALETRLMSGVVEDFRGRRVQGDVQYAYSFGDLTVLLNPAFEGTRFEPLAHAAAGRPYQAGDGDPLHPTAQLPILLVITSNGDNATKQAFWYARALSTVAEPIQNATEREANLHTVGWTERYRTHDLAYDENTPNCELSAKEPLPPNWLLDELVQERYWYHDARRDALRVFGSDQVRFCAGLTLSRFTPKARPQDALRVQPFSPIWVIRADKSVIPDHSNIFTLNSRNFLRQVYFTVLAEEDGVLTRVLHDR